MQVTIRITSYGFLLLAALAFLQPSCSAAQPSKTKLAGPAQSVRDFCRMDFDGVRLSSKHSSAAAFGRLIGGEGEWPEEPVKIVTAFHVLSVTENQDAATVRVAYKVRGQLTGALESDGLTFQRRAENIVFSLLRTDGFWKVKVFDFPPHVSSRALRDHIRDILKDDDRQGDTRRRHLLQHLISKLGSAGP